MTRQIEKLGLTVKQYTVLGTVMMISCLALSAGAFFLADDSLQIGIVLAVVAVEFGIIGYFFLKVAGMLSMSDDPIMTDAHRPSDKSRRNMAAVSTLAALILSACVACAMTIGCFKPKEKTGMPAVVTAAADEVEESQTYEAEAPDEEIEEKQQIDVVYATSTGKRYHYSARCAGPSCFAITIQEALDHSLTPCKNCAIE